MADALKQILNSDVLEIKIGVSYMHFHAFESCNECEKVYFLNCRECGHHTHTRACKWVVPHRQTFIHYLLICHSYIRAY